MGGSDGRRPHAPRNGKPGRLASAIMRKAGWIGTTSVLLPAPPPPYSAAAAARAAALSAATSRRPSDSSISPSTTSDFK